MNKTDEPSIERSVCIEDREGNQVGALLQAQRIKRNLSPADVAQQLKISVAQINAIEQDQYEALPSNIFTRGLTRSYANLLGMDADILIQRLEKNLPLRKYPTPNLSDLYNDRTFLNTGFYHRRSWMNRIVFFIVLFFVLTALSIIAIHYLIETSVIPAHESTNLIQSSAVTQEPYHHSQATIQASHAMAEAPSKTELNVLTAGTLQIRANQASWVKVTDNTQKVLFYGLVNPGDLPSLTGQPPFQVRVGNAQHTTLIYNGKEVNLTAYTKKNIATLEINK